MSNPPLPRGSAIFLERGEGAIVAREARSGVNCRNETALVSRKPDAMGGAAVFYGTRVPVQTPLDYLEAGESIDALLEGFPSVTHAQVIAYLGTT
jgi:uncharacterized protein (DUF433 family)